MFDKKRFSQFAFIIFAGLLPLLGATTGHAQKRAGQDMRLQALFEQGDLALSSARNHSDQDIRLQVRITGIPGKGIGGAIEAFGSDQIVTNTSGSIGGGGEAGKTEFGPLVITKAVDRATPMLFLACATGRRFAEAQIDWIRKDSRGGGDEVFFTVLLQDVTVVAARSGLPNRDDPNSEPSGSVEQISFSFRRIQWIRFLPDGTQVRGGFDVAANREL